MTNENKTAPVEKIASSTDTRYLAIPAAFSVVFITWQDFGKQLEVLARLLAKNLPRVHPM